LRAARLAGFGEEVTGMDELKAIEAFTQQMELTRNEMAALTDALARLNHTMADSAAETKRLATLIETASQRGFWRRLVG
jgi:hypothetical protein